MKTDSYKLDAVFTVDENYLQHFTVACTSLLETNRHQVGHVFLIHDISKTEKLKPVEDFFKKYYNLSIEPIQVSSRLFDHFFVSEHISRSTYFRFLLPELLPDMIDRVLFLDSDIIIRSDLSYLTRLDFVFDNVEYDLYAADHGFDDNGLIDLDKRFGRKFDKYFNAGVLLINLRSWREKNISSVLINHSAVFHDKLVFWDQDVLNLTFQGRWLPLDTAYNHMDVDTSTKRKARVKIVHFLGSSKPWHYLNNHPFKEEYCKYLKMTPFRNYVPPDRTLVNRAKRMMPDKGKTMIKNTFASLRNIFRHIAF